MKQNVNLKTTEQMQMHAYVQMPEWAADKKQKKITLSTSQWTSVWAEYFQVQSVFSSSALIFKWLMLSFHNLHATQRVEGSLVIQILNLLEGKTRRTGAKSFFIFSQMCPWGKIQGPK